MRRCQAYNRRALRCRHQAVWDHYHYAWLCDLHADMDDPPMSPEQAREQLRVHDNAWHQKQRQAS